MSKSNPIVLSDSDDELVPASSPIRPSEWMMNHPGYDIDLSDEELFVYEPSEEEPSEDELSDAGSSNFPPPLLEIRSLKRKSPIDDVPNSSNKKINPTPAPNFCVNTLEHATQRADLWNLKASIEKLRKAVHTNTDRLDAMESRQDRIVQDLEIMKRQIHDLAQGSRKPAF